MSSTADHIASRHLVSEETLARAQSQPPSGKSVEQQGRRRLCVRYNMPQTTARFINTCRHVLTFNPGGSMICGGGGNFSSSGAEADLLIRRPSVAWNHAVSSSTSSSALRPRTRKLSLWTNINGRYNIPHTTKKMIVSQKAPPPSSAARATF